MISGKKILVTGAGGFIGSYLVSRLRRYNNVVRGVDRVYSRYLPQEVLAMGAVADLRNFDEVTRVITHEKPDMIFHFAADMGGIGFITKNGADVINNNMKINANIMKAAAGLKIKKLFFSSSACVYPEYRQDSRAALDKSEKPEWMLKERDVLPAMPDTYYGWEKLAMEKMMQAYHEDYGIDTRIARYHNIFGPFMHSEERDKAPAALCKKVINAKDGTIEIWGSGKQRRSFLYIDDCIDGTLALMESDITEPVNIGSDRAVTIDELADIAIAISGKRLEKVHVAGPVGVDSRNADITMAKEKLGWSPKVSLEDGMKKLYDYLEAGNGE